MSREPGKKQNAIVEFLKGGKGAVAIESMRWSLYEQSNGLLTIGDLPTSWNTSISRAVKGLERDGVISITSRPLQSFEECVEHYPNKTLQAEKRSLRKRFLPLLQDWTVRARGVLPRYDEAANEKFHLEQLSDECLGTLEQRWLRIESSLRPVFGQSTGSADDLLRLICKGRNLFRERDIEVSCSFRATIDAVCKCKLLPYTLADELEQFKQDFLSNQEAGSLRLKSFIHSIAVVPRHRQCTLRTETLAYVHQQDRAYVEGMQGFEEKEPSWPTLWAESAKEYTYSPSLVAIFDQTVFQKFAFIRLVR